MFLKTPSLLIVALAAALMMGACQAQAPSPPPPGPAYRPTSTLKDLMAYVVDPTADTLWATVSIVNDAKGTVAKAPKTDEEWAAVRGYAIQLIEASNLLQIPGRAMARPGEKPHYPGIELEFDEIGRLIESDRAAWNTLAHGLHDKSTALLKPIDAHDAEGFRDASETLYDACENCHKRYWFPPKSPPASK